MPTISYRHATLLAISTSLMIFRSLFYKCAFTVFRPLVIISSVSKILVYQINLMSLLPGILQGLFMPILPTTHNSQISKTLIILINLLGMWL